MVPASTGCFDFLLFIGPLQWGNFSQSDCSALITSASHQPLVCAHADVCTHTRTRVHTHVLTRRYLHVRTYIIYSCRHPYTFAHTYNVYACMHTHTLACTYMPPTYRLTRRWAHMHGRAALLFLTPYLDEMHRDTTWPSRSFFAVVYRQSSDFCTLSLLISVRNLNS